MSQISSQALDQTILSLFDESFKFKVGQPVRHKADTKDYIGELGMLILARNFTEALDSGSSIPTIQKNYLVRCIQHGVAGELHTMVEHELLTVEEYTRFKVKSQDEEQSIRDEMNDLRKMTSEIVYKKFGVKRGDRIKFPAGIYKVTGFKRNGETYDLIARSEDNPNNEIYISDPKDIEKAA